MALGPDGQVVACASRRPAAGAHGARTAGCCDRRRGKAERRKPDRARLTWCKKSHGMAAWKRRPAGRASRALLRSDRAVSEVREFFLIARTRRPPSISRRRRRAELAPIAAFMGELPPSVRESNEAVLNARVDGAVRESSIRLPLAGGNAAERRDRFVHGANRMDVKTTVRYGVHDVLSQHQMLDVVRRDQYALTSRQALLTTEIEKPFDFLVDAADSLYAAVLIDRSGDRHGLRHGNVRQGRQEGARLGERR